LVMWLQVFFSHILKIKLACKDRITKRCCRTIFSLRSKIAAERGVRFHGLASVDTFNYGERTWQLSTRRL
ncbi:MAG: hypothetical protein U1D69_05685, partial [Polynucleobacter sp.]|nr:hypothetical protein [Polynucleobacter sp.]